MVSKKFVLLGLGLLCAAAQASESLDWDTRAIQGPDQIFWDNQTLSGKLLLPPYTTYIIKQLENTGGHGTIQTSEFCKIYIGEGPYNDAIGKGSYCAIRRDGAQNKAKDIRIVIAQNAKCYTSPQWELRPYCKNNRENRGDAVWDWPGSWLWR